jgi:hypothetical protein
VPGRKNPLKMIYFRGKISAVCTSCGKDRRQLGSKSHMEPTPYCTAFYSSPLLNASPHNFPSLTICLIAFSVPTTPSEQSLDTPSVSGSVNIQLLLVSSVQCQPMLARLSHVTLWVPAVDVRSHIVQYPSWVFFLNCQYVGCCVK